MANAGEQSHPHWNYFLALDADLGILSRYIEFDERNFGCFSLELARILLAAASEVDVVAQQVCQRIVPESTASTIGVYRQVILEGYPKIVDFQIVVPRFGLELTPWARWGVGGRPIHKSCSDLDSSMPFIDYHERTRTLAQGVRTIESSNQSDAVRSLRA